jgi:hypothetical protein
MFHSLILGAMLSLPSYCVNGAPDCFQTITVFPTDGNSVVRKESLLSSITWDTFYLSELHKDLLDSFTTHTYVFTGLFTDTAFPNDNYSGFSRRFLITDRFKGAFAQETTTVQFPPRFYFGGFPNFIIKKLLFFVDSNDSIDICDVGLFFGCSADGYELSGDTIIPFGYFHNKFIGLKIPASQAFSPVKIQRQYQPIIRSSKPYSINGIYTLKGVKIASPRKNGISIDMQNKKAIIRNR